MEELDPDEYCAMLEAEARTKNPEEEYKMKAAYLFGSLREKIDELDKLVDDLIGKIEQQRSDQKRQNKHTDALPQSTERCENCRGE